MNRSLGLLFLLSVFAANNFIAAQDNQENTREASRRFRGQALVIEIDARVLDTTVHAEALSDTISEETQVVVWHETHQRTTMPGSPAGLKLIGSNIVLVMQFTPFVRRSDRVLVAQGQIFINDPENGMRYYTSIQTIPMEFGEPIYFFPLGSSQMDPCIEIVLTVNLQSNTSAENEN